MNESCAKILNRIKKKLAKKISLIMKAIIEFINKRNELQVGTCIKITKIKNLDRIENSAK